MDVAFWVEKDNNGEVKFDGFHNVVLDDPDGQPRWPGGRLTDACICPQCCDLLGWESPEAQPAAVDDIDLGARVAFSEAGREVQIAVTYDWAVGLPQTTCALCRLVLQQLSPPAAEPEARDSLLESPKAVGATRPIIVRLLRTQWTDIPGDNIDFSLIARVEGLERDVAKAKLTLIPASEISLDTEQPRPAGFVDYRGTSTLIERSNNSLSTWSLARAWIRHCDVHHACCEHIQDGREVPLPARLVYVGHEGPIRVVMGASLQRHTSRQQVGYATLSHRWGHHVPLKLLESNIDALMTEISWVSLPKTFQDAVTACREIDIDYIWIDSLCIIQDSAQDWQEQSAKMASIYSNSYCNIFAAAANDDTDGLFTTREPETFMPLAVNLKWGPEPGLYHVASETYWSEGLSDAGLLGRAWVYQEYVLSPRKLIFGPHETWFECSRGAASERYPRGILHELTLANRMRGVRMHRGRKLVEMAYKPNREPKYRPFDLWNIVVESYAQRDITFVTDALVALSAIASEVSRLVDGEYLAGLWRPYMHSQLLWSTFMPPSRREAEYVTPSWAWPRAIGWGVSCESVGSTNERILADIVDAQVERVSPANPFGQVKGGFLRITGHLALGTVRRAAVDGFPSDQFLEAVFGVGHDAAAAATLDYFHTDDELEHANFVFAALLGMIASDTGEDFYVRGLVLRPVPGMTGTFLREGIFSTRGSAAPLQQACRDFSGADLGLEFSPGSSDSSDVVWGTKHLLTII
jgi:hypothetical protein